jgi:hypothetical protein
MTVVAIGSLARRALAQSGGCARPLAAFPQSPYFAAAGEILWVGAALPAMHPRAVLTATPQPRGRMLVFPALPRETWSPTRLAHVEQASMNAALGRLLKALLAVETPRGCGALLAGAVPDFPLDLCEGRVRSLARAYAADDAEAVYEASLPLLGFGAGLTPSGDDLTGGALFGRRAIADEERWQAIAGRLAREIEARSHAVSAVLFGDLARGESFAPLHALLVALACADDSRALAHARLLICIGHSSGWDMLTGMCIGIGGTLS